MKLNWTDEEIIEKIQDEKTINYGFNLLMDKYQEKVYSVIRRMVIDHDAADDAAQETFVKVWKNIEKCLKNVQNGRNIRKIVDADRFVDLFSILIRSFFRAFNYSYIPQRRPTRRS